MYKVLVSCGAGIGSSMIMKKNVENFLKDAGVDYEVTHESIGTAKSGADKYDLIFTLESMKQHFAAVKDQSKIVGLKNVVAKDEVEKAIQKMIDAE